MNVVMSDTFLPLEGFKKNVTSQFGEDGIIEEVLRRISCSTALDRWCVEFGAWDGKHLSNTFQLIERKGYKAVLIEGDPARYRQLCKNLPQDSVIKIEAFVGFDGESALDRILARTPIPQEFDLLSIDVDGCDYFFFDSLKAYRPKVVCIEYNPTIPNDVEFVQPKRMDVCQGASARSLTKLAEGKGYALVGATSHNLFYVRDDLRTSVIGPMRLGLDQVRDDAGSKTYLFCGYDGTLLMNRKEFFMPWHNLRISQECLQPLPKLLRVFPGNYAMRHRLAFAVFLLFAHPTQFLERLRLFQRGALRKITRLPPPSPRQEKNSVR